MTRKVWSRDMPLDFTGYVSDEATLYDAIEDEEATS